MRYSWGIGMQTLHLIGLSSLRMERALKAKTNPKVLSGQLPLEHLKITSGRRAVMEQCFVKEPDPRPCWSHWKVFHSLWRTSVNSEGKKKTALVQSWEGDVASTMSGWRGARAHPTTHLDALAWQKPLWDSRAIQNAAQQSFPLNSLKLLDRKRQYSFSFFFFLSPFARWSLFCGEILSNAIAGSLRE